MRLINKTPGCTQISLINNQLFMVIDDKTYLEDRLIFDDKINVAWQGCVVDGQIYFSYGNSLLVLNEKRLLPFFEDESYTYFRLIDNDKILCSSRIAEMELKYSLMNLDKKELWNETGYIRVTVLDDNYMLVGDRIKRTPFETRTIMNEKLWKFDLPEGFNMSGAEHLIDNVLYITARDKFYRNQLSIGLDINTGEVIWQYNQEITIHSKLIIANIYNPADKLYYHLGNKYQIFNPKTGEIVLEEPFDIGYKYDIIPVSNSIFDNKLWFVSGKRKDTKFGCFNLDTRQLEHIQDFPQDNDEQIIEPVYHKGKLYLKGNYYNDLFVFE